MGATMTERLTSEELDKRYPGWREGRKGKSNTAIAPQRDRRTSSNAAATRLSAFLDLIRELLDRELDVRLEYRFEPKRRWRADLAILEPPILLEIEGGIYSQGGGAHQRVKRFKSDIEKYNAATSKGWKLFRVGWEHVLNGQAMNLIESALPSVTHDKNGRR
jgi:hypothetical protein